MLWNTSPPVLGLCWIAHEPASALADCLTLELPLLVSLTETEPQSPETVVCCRACAGTVRTSMTTAVAISGAKQMSAAPRSVVTPPRHDLAPKPHRALRTRWSLSV